MSTTDTDPKDPHAVPAQLRGETMAYALQNVVYNVGANFFEPYINHRIQKYYAGHHPGAQFGKYSQNLAGEFAGDIIGSSTLIVAEAVAPRQLHRFTRMARGWVDPLYTSVAHMAFAKEKCEPGYEQKIEQWKLFQERNLVRSAIMATANIAGNIVTQKTLFKNPAPTGLIFAGKLASTSLTTALSLGVRLAFPKQMSGMDRWLGKNLFAPVLSEATNTPASHVEKLTGEKESPSPAR